ncbi:MAG: hypothetical protein HY678_03545 [Chloroflexi bacterium]|nr:hypothetical protein [Chloroflexota bacterium]
MFITRRTYYPALGKTQETSTVLKDWVKQRPAQGVRVGLVTRLFPPSGAEYQTLVIADDLGQLQEDRKKSLANPAVIAFVQKIDGLEPRSHEREPV